MDREERFDALRIVWGPPPTDPGDRTVWEHGLWLMSELPDLLARLIIEEGTTRPTLITMFGLEGLAELEAGIAELFLCRRWQEEMREAVRSFLGAQPWTDVMGRRSAVQQTRIANRLAEDVVLNIELLILRDPPLRGWLGADW